MPPIRIRSNSFDMAFHSRAPRPGLAFAKASGGSAATGQAGSNHDNGSAQRSDLQEICPNAQDGFENSRPLFFQKAADTGPNGNLNNSGAPEKDFVSWKDILNRHGSIDMELRHLRYFVAIAETGSFTAAAEQKLHTAQPSLSRQIRDLEAEVGVPLLTRGAHGARLTAAGRAFLDHARMVLAQVEAATQAARRVAHPAKPVFALGFLTGRGQTR